MKPKKIEKMKVMYPLTEPINKLESDLEFMQRLLVVMASPLIRVRRPRSVVRLVQRTIASNDCLWLLACHLEDEW